MTALIDEFILNYERGRNKIEIVFRRDPLIMDYFDDFTNRL
jgi:hypothetical protein